MSEWIDIKDQLPKIGSWVIAFGKARNKEYDDEPSIAITRFGYNPHTKEHYYEYLSSGCGCCNADMREVTHWMPLPEKPR